MIQAVILFPVLVLGLYGLGEWLRAKLVGEEPFSVGRIGRAFGFGILAHGLLMTILGFTCLLNPLVAAVLTALPAVLFCQVWFRDLRLMLGQIFRKPSPHLNVVESAFIVIIVLVTLIRGFNALAPNISWDATSHHYLVPSVWLQAGRVSDIPSVIFSYYPSLTEIGISGTMALGTDFLSNLYGWMFGALSILLLIGIGVRHFNTELAKRVIGSGRMLAIDVGRFSGITAALLFTLLPGVGVQTSGGYVDLPLACWTLLAIDLIFELSKRTNWRVLISAALFAGAALSTKHLGIPILLGLIVLLARVLTREVDSRIFGRGNHWKFVLAFIGIAILLPLPWYIRSICLTGNPIYPFGLFGLPAPPHPPFTPSSWMRPDYIRSFPGLITYWLHLAFSPTVAAELGRNYSLAFPLLFPMVVLIPFLSVRGRLLTSLGLLATLVIYALFPVETRYHVPLLAPIALTFGLLIGKWVSNPRFNWIVGLLLISEILAVIYILLLGSDTVAAQIKTRAIIPIGLIVLATLPFFVPGLVKRNVTPVLILLLVLGIGSLGYDFMEDSTQLLKRWKVVLNLEAEDKYMLRGSPFNYGTIHQINNNMDHENMRILCLEPRLYRLKADWVTWYGLEEPIVPTTPAENVAIWYRGGFTHILLGDDIALKALMFFNIVHKDDWDVSGATPEELVDHLREHPDEDEVKFQLQDLWTNFAGDPFTGHSEHFTHFWLPRELTIALFPTEEIDGETWYTASRLKILTDPTSLNQYAFVRDFREMVDTGGINVAYTDELTFLFECDYPAYLESHPNVDLETLGLAGNE